MDSKQKGPALSTFSQLGKDLLIQMESILSLPCLLQFANTYNNHLIATFTQLQQNARPYFRITLSK